MNKHAYVQAIQLIGKLVDLYGIDFRSSHVFTGTERALIEQCLREWEFYKPSGEQAPAMEARTKRESVRKAQGV